MTTREVAQQLSYSERTIKAVMHDVTTKLHSNIRSFFFTLRRPQSFTQPTTLFPYTTLFRSRSQVATLPLVPAVVDAVAPVPVIAAGGIDRKSTRLNSSHRRLSRMPSSA